MKLVGGQASVWASAYFANTIQTLYPGLVTFTKICQDIDASQKAALFALSTIKCINYYLSKDYLPGLIIVLGSAAYFDFFGFIRDAHLYTHPFIVDRLDKIDLHKQIHDFLCSHWNVKDEEKDALSDDIKTQLISIFKEMEDENITFSFEEDISRYITNSFKANPMKNWPAIDFIFNLKIKLKERSFLDLAAIIAFVVTDVTCVPSFLDEFNIIKLSHYTPIIGRIPVFSRLAKTSYDDWIWRILTLGNCFTAVNSALALKNCKLSDDEKKNNCWLLASSVAECVYGLSILLKKDDIVITHLALVAKLLGLVAFLVHSNPPHFDDAESTQKAE